MKVDETEDEQRWARLRSDKPWTADDARWVFESQVASGQTIAAFAAQRGLHVNRLYEWRARLKKRRVNDKSTRVRPVALVPVTVQPTAVTIAGDCALVISTNGVRVEVRELNGASRSWVAELLGIKSTT
jgi:hypothetical protein